MDSDAGQGQVLPRAGSESDPGYRDDLLRLYDRSVLKKAKFRAITEYLPRTDEMVCLDIGADNGVLSYLLRRRGGRWHSADLEPGVVESIRLMVGENVYRFDGGPIPFEDDYFDLVVIIDFLEHIDNDSGFIAELGRVSKPGAALIVNVPHYRPRSWIRRLRLWVGLTDERHGHVRPGYDIDTLTSVLGEHFRIIRYHTYSGFLVELFDVATSLMFEGIAANRHSAKGAVVTGRDIQRHRKKFLLFSLVYPLVWLLARIDACVFWADGHSLIALAEHRQKG